MENTRARAGQLRRHVHDDLSVGEQALGEVLTDPVAALHRPHPIREPATDDEHVPIAGGVGGEPALAENTLRSVEYFDGGGPFVRIHAKNNRTQIRSSAPGEDARQKRATRNHRGQPKRERPAEHLDRAWPGTGRTASLK